MAIEKSNFKVSRFDSEFFHGSGETMSTDEGELQPRIPTVESDDNVDDGFEDVDSGAGSDEFDFLELAEAGAEFCKVGNVTCSIPFDLYDLSGLEDILSVDVWNDSLTEEDRLYLTKFLPDMDQHIFMRTLKELFEGSNFHFGSPIKRLFEMLKSGQCEPRNALYLEGRNFFQRTKHCHHLRKYHNDMVVNLCQIRNAWSNCKGYSMHEKLRVLNILKSQKKLMNEKIEDFGANSSDRDESLDVLWSRRVKVSNSKGKKFGPNKAASKASRPLTSSEDTESDSSEQYHDDEERNPMLWSRLAYSGDGMHGSHSLPKSKGNGRKAKLGKKDTQENEWALDGVNGFANNLSSLNEHGYMAGAENYLSKARLKRKMPENSPLDNYTIRDFEDNSTLGLQRFKNEEDRRQIRKLGKNKRSQQRHLGDSFPRSFRNREALNEDEDLPELRSLVNDSCGGRAGREGFVIEEHMSEVAEKLDPEGSTVKKKRKVKESFIEVGRAKENCLQSIDHHLPIDDSIPSKKKGKKKLEAGSSSPTLVTPETQRTEIVAMDADMEIKPQKKPFTLITPTVHTGFSFSIIHLLSAVRMAMISARPEDSLEIGRLSEELSGGHDGQETGVSISKDADTNKLHPLPSLTVHEIVNCVRSNPGDPCILETQEPLQDLVRGVLKIFSSKTSPLGAKGWKTLVAYEKSIKSWSWIGPVPQSLTDHETAEEVTSPEAWALPHKMLVKLVDAFASWLKNGQETLRQIGSLPEPPLSMMQCNLDEKERFKDLKAQKSLNTITPSSDEVKSYFRREEVLRYSIPDRAFAYTAADGKKSVVAPLRRGGGKPTSKARDHFMLKRDRPPHVTILCLVRDAAARLPGSTGTRADVCTLIRDSQYIVEDVTDSQVNQVVSGALDRLHYERDPCVQFDSEKKLWAYLHRDREEEDFEDDGTSSTKKWKRPKKDVMERSDQGAVTIAYHANEDQSGIDLGSDLNADPAFTEEDKGTEILCNDAIQSAADNADYDTHENHTMVWNTVGPNSVQENKILCQENSANEDFDDEI